MFTVAAIALFIGMILVLVRLYNGPTLYDRVLAANSFGTHTVLESTVEVPAGDCVFGVHLERVGREGWIELAIDGEPCGRVDLPVYIVSFNSTGASIGMDHGSAVSPRYQAPFAFSGTLHDVTIQLPGGYDPEVDVAEARAEWSRQ